MAKKSGEPIVADEAKAPRGSRFSLPAAVRPEEWPLRRKVVVAILLPVVLAMTLGGMRVQEDRSRASDFTTSASRVTVLEPAIAYLQSVETAILSGRGVIAMANGAALDATIEDVVAAGEELEAAAVAADLTAAQANEVSEILRLSEQLRTAQGYASVGQSISQLRQLQRGVNRLIAAIGDGLAEPEPRLQLLGNLIDGRVSLTVQLFTAASADTGKKINAVDLGSEVGVEAGAIERIAAFLSLEDPDVRRLRAQNATRLGEAREGGTGLGGEEAFSPYDRVSGEVLSAIEGDLAAAGKEASAAAIRDIALVLAALFLTLALAMFISRLLLGQIRKVREGTLRVAQERLPRAVRIIRAGGDPGEALPIDVHTREEMGELARAVDSLHGEAIKLAVREAKLADQIGEMFVTLSRRSTSLINQQLGLIDKLERDEEDPERLESLFRLDHLASRMRRTADSLNILADAPATSSDSRGLSVSDVLHAAIAGVQDYQRVDIDSTATEFLAGAAASDVVHLITELTDNALSFSPPTSRVQVSSKRSPDGVIIQVIDSGLGMKPEMLESLNDELRSGGEVTPETARRMGMLVVSRLAKRHGVTVELQKSVRGGIVAHIELPTAILRTSDQPTSAAKPDRPSARILETDVETRPLSALEAYADEDSESSSAPQQPAAPAAAASASSSALAAELASAATSTPPQAPAAPDTPAQATPAAAVSADIEKKSALAARLQSMREARAAAGLNNPGEARSASAAFANAGGATGTSNPPSTPSDKADANGGGGSVEDAINAVIRLPQRGAPDATPVPPPNGPSNGQSNGLPGLPRRNPGAAELPGAPLQPLAPPRGAVAVPGPDARVEPEAAEPAAASEQAAAPQTPEVAEVPNAPEAPAAEVTATEAEAPSEPAAAPAPTAEPVVEPVQASVTKAEPSSILDATVPLPDDASSDEGTIFASMQSSWFSSSDNSAWATEEVDDAWTRADKVAEVAPVEVGTSGLPVRRPGSRVVPGGVSTATGAAVRDPEAIRARLAAHSAGVNRGRQASQGSTALDERPHDRDSTDPASQESDPT